MSSVKTKLTRNKRKKTKRQPNSGEYTGVPTIVRSPTRLIPDQMDIVLTYPNKIAITNGAGLTAAKRFTPNAAYDVDPTLGSTATPGFAEWAAMYYKYRVTHYRIVADVVNLDTSPIVIYSVNTNADPGTAGTSYIDYECQPYCKKVMLSPNGSGPTNRRIVHNISVANLVGTAAVDTDDTFAALVTGVPANLMWWGVGIDSMNANPAAGVAVSFVIEMSVRFYDRKSLVTTFRDETPDEQAKRTVFKMERCRESRGKV